MQCDPLTGLVLVDEHVVERFRSDAVVEHFLRARQPPIGNRRQLESFRRNHFRRAAAGVCHEVSQGNPSTAAASPAASSPGVM